VPQEPAGYVELKIIVKSGGRRCGDLAAGFFYGLVRQTVFDHQAIVVLGIR